MEPLKGHSEGKKKKWGGRKNNLSMLLRSLANPLRSTEKIYVCLQNVLCCPEKLCVLSQNILRSLRNFELSCNIFVLLQETLLSPGKFLCCPEKLCVCSQKVLHSLEKLHSLQKCLAFPRETFEFPQETAFARKKFCVSLRNIVFPCKIFCVPPRKILEKLNFSHHPLGAP